MNNYLPTDYQNFIALSRYARWNDEEQRRETWLETVDRYFDYMDNHLKTKNDYTITKALKEKMTDAIVSLSVMPSMRALMTAGVALDRCHVAGITVVIYLWIVQEVLMNVCIFLCVAQVLDSLLKERMLISYL